MGWRDEEKALAGSTDLGGITEESKSLHGLDEVTVEECVEGNSRGPTTEPWAIGNLGGRSDEEMKNWKDLVSWKPRPNEG